MAQNQVQDMELISGGYYTKNIASTYTASPGAGLPNIIGFFVPDPTTTFTEVLDDEGNDIKELMGLDVVLYSSPPVYRWKTTIKKITCSAPITLILSR